MSEHRELRDRDVAESWLAAGLCLSRLGRSGGDDFIGAAQWLVEAVSELGALPPAGVIADIGHLLTGDTLREVAPLPRVAPTLRDALSGYEDHVLGRLEADPRLDAAIDAVGQLSEELRDAAIAQFCNHLLVRIEFRAAVAIGPGVVRRALRMPADELGARGHAALVETGAVFDLLLAGYRALIAGARRLGSLIGESEVFLLENFSALGELSHRLAITQMLDAAGTLADTLPRRLKPRPHDDLGRIPTTLSAEDNYPTGGFSSLATSGSMENLVTSELIYMDDPPVAHERGQNETGQPGGRGDIDLFDVRYAEGELLYYTRDESVFVRSRRVIGFILAPDLDQVRFQDAGLPWQRLVLALGLIGCAVRRLAEWLEREGLYFPITFVRGGSDPLAGERSLCALMLRDWIAREMAEVSSVDDFSGALRRADTSALSADTRAVIISAQPLAIEPRPGVVMGNLCLGQPTPTLRWSHRIDKPSAAGGDELWPRWTQVTFDLLSELI